MTTFEDEVREIATNGAAAGEIAQFKKLIREKAAKGFREVELAEFYYSKHDTLGTVEVDLEKKSVVFTGPIKAICAALQAEGIQIFVQQDMRFKNHPRGSGVMQIVLARF